MAPNEDRFVVQSFRPAYVDLLGRGGLEQRVRTALESLRGCRVCPRECNVDRLAGETKVCHIGRYARVASAFAHFGEEECLQGRRGSGAIFFARCNLRCVFCQNADISQADAGRECGPEAIAGIMLDLQAEGCHNINLVTPEHVVPQVIEALATAIERGLRLPVVYNTSAYDSLESLRHLDGLVDVYMPDFKLWSQRQCARLLGAKDYGRRAREAIFEMHRQVGDLKLTPDGLACRGLMVRHLVMPGMLDETTEILGWLARKVSPDTYINIMGQYRPAHRVPRSALPWHENGDRVVLGSVDYSDIGRAPTREELRRAFHLARTAGLWRFG